MESQPQNPELRNNPENFHPCKVLKVIKQLDSCRLTSTVKHFVWRIYLFGAIGGKNQNHQNMRP